MLRSFPLRLCALGAFAVLAVACNASSSTGDAAADAAVDGSRPDSRPGDATADVGALGDSGPSDVSVTADGAHDLGPSCDPASFTAHCQGTVLHYCPQATGGEKTLDCAGTSNPVCVETAGGPQCLVSTDTSQCVSDSSLAPCQQVQGQAHALFCTESAAGVVTSYYAPCSSGYCKPTDWNAQLGQCTGAPCSGPYRKCVGDELHVCETQGGLTVYDCTLSSQVCTESSLGNGWAVCNAPGEAACDPTTFVKSCSSDTAGVFCASKLGYTAHFDCATVGKVCCFDVDAGVNPNNNCC